MTGVQRLALRMGLLGALVVAGVLGLWAAAASGVEATVAARHDDALQRVVSGLERRLAERVAREEARSFLEYRYLYVPQDNANPAVVRSPLSKAPDDPAIRGFFTLEPDGAFRSPADPRGNEVEWVAAKNWEQGAGSDPGLERLVRSLPAVPTEGGVQEAVPAQVLAPMPVQRAAQRIATKRYNVDTFASASNSFRPGDGADGDVSVEVRPFVGFRRGDDLILIRDVVAEGQRYRQGLVLDLRVLLEETAAAVLAEEAAPEVDIAWNGLAAEGRWVRGHTFPPPLQDLRAQVGIPEVPALVGPVRGATRALGAAVLALLVGGAWLVWRTVRAELDYAERRSDFVSAVTHELKTPLTAIRMYAEMLRDGMVPDERRGEYLGTVLSESDRLGRLVGNVLTLAQLERGTAAPRLVAGDVAAVLGEALDVVRPHAAAHGFRLEVDAPPGLPPARLDRDGLVQVVVNLVDNAVKFAATGDRTLTFTLRPHDRGVALALRDRGPGVPEAQLPRVFEPFWRGERELVRRTQGTGIGLSLVKGLVAGMGGEVTARNAAGGGFVVELVLPRAATA